MTDPNIVIDPPGKEYVERGYSKTHYWCPFFCTNCHEHSSFLLPKGMRKKGLKIDCPRCGCEETV